MNTDRFAFVRAFLTEERRTLLLLFSMRSAAVLLTLGAVWTLARIVDLLFLGGAALSDTASEFRMLFFLLVFRTLLMIPEGRQQRALACRLLLSAERRLHALLAPVKLPAGTMSRLAIETSVPLELLALKILPSILTLAIWIPILLFAALVADPLTALLLFISLPVAPLLLWLIGQASYRRSLAQWERQAHLAGGFEELLHGILSLKIFRRIKAEEQELLRLSRAFSDASFDVLRLAFLSSFALELITTLSIAILSVSIGFRLLAGNLAFSTAFFLLLLAPEFYQPLRESGAVFHAFMDVRAAMEKLLPYLSAGEKKSSVISAAVPKKGKNLAQGESSLMAERFFAPVEESSAPRTKQSPPPLKVAGLSYTYPGTAQPVFQNLSLSVEAGAAVCLTGLSGAGKSTLLRLLAGFIRPDAGSIRWGDSDEPAKNGMPAAYVPQRPHLFAASLAENLTVFRKVSEKRIEQCLLMTGLDSLVCNLPDGLDTMMGEGGRPLSEGQLHRLGVARAILSDPSFLLIDEPTAGLDEEGEAEILSALSSLRERCTMLVVSHRPLVRAWADDCIVLAREEAVS